MHAVKTTKPNAKLTLTKRYIVIVCESYYSYETQTNYFTSTLALEFTQTIIYHQSLKNIVILSFKKYIYDVYILSCILVLTQNSDPK